MKWRTIARAKARLAKETGVIHKNWGGKLRVALAFPNDYYVAMSSLALQILYRRLNAFDDVVCERAFWDKAAIADGEPLITLESQQPVAEFDLLAFTISYEMDYFNLTSMLRQAGIPPLAEDRVDKTWPLLIAGGPVVSMNPEPIAPFFDAFVIGEGEEVLEAILSLAQAQLPRQELLAELSRLPGVYVPLLHPTRPDSQPVERLWAREYGAFEPVSAIYTPDTEFGDMHLIEIARGCGRGCRFCLAGYIYRPPREQPLEQILAWAEPAIRQGRRIGLVSAAVSDYSRIDELAMILGEKGARISVSSMRTDPLSVPLVEAMAASGTRTLTIAPEAGSERLRRVISKMQPEETLFAAVDLAEKLNFPQLKLYFMVGHPSETEADIQAIVDFTLEARKRFRRQITINATPFVPKAQTPFQWMAMTPAKVLKQRQRFLQKALGRHKVAIRADSPAWAEVQGVLARGDRRLAQVLLSVERLSVRAFYQAMEQHGLDASEYLGVRDPVAFQPWQVVSPNVSLRFLQRELHLAEQERPGHACSPEAKGCLVCGACDVAWAFRDRPPSSTLPALTAHLQYEVHS